MSVNVYKNVYSDTLRGTFVVHKCDVESGKLHHLGVGHEPAGQHVLIIVDHTGATVTHLNTVEILGEYLIDPNKNYRRNRTNSQADGLAPSEYQRCRDSSFNDVPTHQRCL
jgi:hypothetical protein